MGFPQQIIIIVVRSKFMQVQGVFNIALYKNTSVLSVNNYAFGERWCLLKHDINLLNQISFVQLLFYSISLDVVYDDKTEFA